MTRNSFRAFSLIELFVVVVIIAVLAALAFPVFTGVLERAKATKDMSNLRQIGLATQTYMNDNDGILFSTAAGAGSWMAQLNPKYLSAWGVLQSPFDRRSPSELGTVATPVSYGFNGNNIIGTAANNISKPSIFILFAPAQASGAAVSFQGTAGFATLPGVKVLGIGGNQATSTPGGNATGGTHSSRNKINALFADLHLENMTWGVFTNNANIPSDPSATQRWSP